MCASFCYPLDIRGEGELRILSVTDIFFYFEYTKKIMMTIRLIYFGLYLSLSFLVHQTYSQSFICNSIEGYDTLGLTR
jgi:hypothetical protein